MTQRFSRAQLLATGASALAFAPQILRSQTIEKIHFCGVPTDDLAPVFFAIENGLYKKAGLDVEFVSTASGTAATTAVIAGAYEIGKGSAIAAFIAHLKDVPIVLIANGVIWEPTNHWSLGLVASDSPYKTAADLNGQTLCAAAITDLSTLAMKYWIDKNGGDSKSLKWVEIPNASAGQAVAEHRVAACQLNEPQLHAAIESGKLRVYAPFLESIASTYSLTNFFVRPDWGKKNAALVERFVKVTYETAQYTNTHPAETAPLMASITKIPVEVIRKMTRAHASTSSDPAMVQPAIDAAAKYGLITRSFPAKEMYFTG